MNRPRACVFGKYAGKPGQGSPTPIHRLENGEELLLALAGLRDTE